MSLAQDPLPFARLLLALGAGGGRISVEFSAQLASLLSLPLEALFIEDEELLAVAALPVTREISRLGVALPDFEPMRLERDLRRHAARLERLVQSCVAGRTTGCRFQVVRGRTAATLSAALRPGDLLVLSREFGPVSGPGGLGNAVLAALNAGWSGLLLMDETMPIPPGPVTAWLDPSLASQQALRFAQRLAAGQGRRLRVLLPPAGAAGPGEDELRHLALTMAPPAPQFQRLSSTEEPVAWLARVRNGLLVLPDASLGLAGRRLEEFLRRVRVPLVLLRNTPEPGPQS